MKSWERERESSWKSFKPCGSIIYAKVVKVTDTRGSKNKREWYHYRKGSLGPSLDIIINLPKSIFLKKKKKKKPQMPLNIKCFCLLNKIKKYYKLGTNQWSKANHPLYEILLLWWCFLLFLGSSKGYKKQYTTSHSLKVKSKDSGRNMFRQT